MKLRGVLAILLSLLLVGMQVEGYAHALKHDRERLAHSQEQYAELPQPDPCAECGWLSGGAGALVAHAPACPIGVAHDSVAVPTPVSRDLCAPVYYPARGPPQP